MEPQRQNKDNNIQYITMIFVGGLLIDLEGRIVGMNFIDENKTPFLPVQIVGRCLKHFRKFGTLLSCIWDDCLKDLVLVSYPTRFDR